MILDKMSVSIQGFVKIIDKDSGDILVDTHNDVLYGNAAVAIAYSLIGNPDSVLYYMAFGNGGSPGRPSLGGPTSIAKNPTANLYDTVYVKKVSNYATSQLSFDADSVAFVSNENSSTNFEDIIIDVTIRPSEPPLGINPTSEIIFSEIGLFAGSDNLFSGSATQTAAEVSAFISATPNFSNTASTKSKLMLTHVIFSPITKSTIQSIEIVYTLRIQINAG
jgi:peptidoglycan hydrolase-like protein with peptidoglycan-binding domain